MTHEWRRDGYVISTDPARLDIPLIHEFLRESYWAQGVSFEQVRRSVDASINFGCYRADQQVGYARVLTDYRQVAYLADVFVVDDHRGRGLGKWLVETALAHPDCQDIKRWELRTKDAHGLYAQFGFGEIIEPERFMELRLRD